MSSAETISLPDANAQGGSPPKAFVARRFTDSFEEAIAQRFEVVRPEHDLPVDAVSIIEQARGCTTLFVSATERLPEEVFDALAPTLDTVATLSVGFDHISLDAARRHGVSVLITPDVLSAACSEVAMLLILNAARRGYEADHMVRSGGWPGWAPTQLLGVGLTGRRLGILGMGRIGREVAARARAFGLTIGYHNRSRVAAGLEAGARYYSSVDQLFENSDILCICAPGGAELRGLVDKTRIGLMPANAIIVNIARGDMIDDDALIEALTSGRLFAAGLDVFRGEPEIDPRYRTLPNVFLSPHIGSATQDARDAMGKLLIDAIDALAAGENPTNRVC